MTVRMMLGFGGGAGAQFAAHSAGEEKGPAGSSTHFPATHE